MREGDHSRMKRLYFIAIFVFASLWLLSSCAASDQTTIGSVNRLGTQSVLRTQYAAASTLAIQQTQALFDANQATLVSQQLRATEVAAVVNVTLTSAANQATSTAIVAETQQSLQVTGTTQAIIAQANQIYYQQQQQQLDINRRQMFNSILGITVFLIILGVLALAAWGVLHYLRRTVEQREKEELQTRSPYVVFDRYGRRMVVGGPNGLTAAPVVDTVFSPPAPSAYSPETENGSGLEGVRRITPPSDLPVTAPWRVVAEDWQGGDLPLGLGPEGMIAADPQTDPHLLITGTPGSGKANLAVRPVIAEALAQGWQAVIFDRTGNDYQVFQKHPNASLALLEEEGPGEVIIYLRRLFGEVQRRKAQMESAGARRWADLANRPADLLAVFSNFSYEVSAALSYPDRNELWEFARQIAALGGAVGVHLVLVMEDPSFTDIDLRIRRFMSPVAFRAGSPLVSRVVLNMDGAENLYPRQFIAILDGQAEFGFAFAPSNNDLNSFLARHPQAHLPRPEWLGQERESGS